MQGPAGNLQHEQQHASLPCPKSRVGRIIGKGGETVRALQSYSGAMIQIDQSSDPCRVTAAGSKDSLELAVSLLTDIISGTFKGFAMLRQLTGASQHLLGLANPVYVRGHGFLPAGQGTHHMMGHPVHSVGQDLGTSLTFGTSPLSLGPLNSQPTIPLSNSASVFGSPQSTSRVGTPTGRTQGLLMSPPLDTSSSVNSLSTDSASSTAGSFQLWASSPMAPLASGSVAGSLPGATAGWLQIADPEGRSFWLDSSTGRARWSMPGTV